MRVLNAWGDWVDSEGNDWGGDGWRQIRRVSRPKPDPELENAFREALGQVNKLNEENMELKELIEKNIALINELNAKIKELEKAIAGLEKERGEKVAALTENPEFLEIL